MHLHLFNIWLECVSVGLGCISTSMKWLCVKWVCVCCCLTYSPRKQWKGVKYVFHISLQTTYVWVLDCWSGKTRLLKMSPWALRNCDGPLFPHIMVYYQLNNSNWTWKTNLSARYTRNTVAHNAPVIGALIILTLVAVIGRTGKAGNKLGWCKW